MEIFSPKLKKYQRKFDYSYAFGPYPTIDLLKHKRDSVLEVLLNSNNDGSESVQEVVRLCKEFGIKIEEQDRAIERIAFKENTYTVGVFKKYECELEVGKNHLVLVEPRNMGNLGTIIRTMLAFGIKDLAIIKPAVDIFDPKVVSSTMGAIFQVNFKYYGSIEEYLKDFSNHHIYTFMLDGAKDIRQVKFEEPFSMVQGSESSGLPRDFKNLGQSVYIPQSKDIDSLNLSVATAIGLWESSKK